MPPPILQDELPALHQALQQLTSTRQGKIQLHYSALVSHRITVSHDLEQPRRSFSVWAITGWLCPTGYHRALPVGWSGRGQGLSWIKNKVEPELEFLDALLVKAEGMTSGSVPVVLSPSAAAVILHEVIGHRAEACIGDYKVNDSTVASECVSVVDDPLAPGGPALYEYDDENVRYLAPTQVVSEGKLVARLHSPHTAKLAGTLPTPNARAASCWDVPIPRMSNLLCAPGTASEEQMLEHLWCGLYIHRLANGLNNGHAVQADIVLAERVERGKRTGKFVTSGKVRDEIDLLRRALEIGNDSQFNSNAMCGRETQLLFNVGVRSPAIRLSSLGTVA